MVKINFLVNSRTGLGHCSRLVAVVQSLARKGVLFQIRVFHHPNTGWFLRSHFHDMDHCELIPFFYRSNYDDSFFDPEDVYSASRREEFWIENRKARSALLDADLFMTDWLGQIGYIRTAVEAMRKKCLFIGLYHSDVWVHEADNTKIRNWKRHIQHIVDNMLDLFLHVTPVHPSEIYPFNTVTFPVPLVVRETTCDEAMAKKLIGLDPCDDYVLVSVGLSSTDRQYVGKQYLKPLVDSIPAKKVVVLGGSQTQRTICLNGNKSVILMPQVAYGQNLVAAASVVIAKPGMSIISECISNVVPVLLLPPDSSERFLKIGLLESVLGFTPPMIEGFSGSEVIDGFEKTLALRERFSTAFRSIPRSGADVVAAMLDASYQAPGELDQAAVLELARISSSSFACSVVSKPTQSRADLA